MGCATMCGARARVAFLGFVVPCGKPPELCQVAAATPSVPDLTKAAQASQATTVAILPSRSRTVRCPLALARLLQLMRAAARPDLAVAAAPAAAPMASKPCRLGGVYASTHAPCTHAHTQGRMQARHARTHASTSPPPPHAQRRPTPPPAPAPPRPLVRVLACVRTLPTSQVRACPPHCPTNAPHHPRQHARAQPPLLECNQVIGTRPHTHTLAQPLLPTASARTGRHSQCWAEDAGGIG